MLFSLVVTGVLAASDAPREYDAFLENTQEQAITDGLRPEALELLSRSFVTAVEPRRGVPTLLWAERFPGARTLRDQGLTAPEAARQHLLRYAAVYRLAPSLIGRLVISEVHDLGKGAVIVGFARAHEGVPLLRDELDVVMTERYELIALTGSLATQPLPLGDFRLSASTAIATAAQHLTGTFASSETLRLLAVRAGGWSLYERGVFVSSPRARRVYFDDGQTLVPAWHLEVETPSKLHALVLSAVDGRLLCLADLESSAAHTYRVWADPIAPFRPLDSPAGDTALPHPTALPDTFNPLDASPVLVTLDNAGLMSNDPWLPAGATELSGNNVHAYADLAAPDGLDGGDDLLVVPSAGATFDYTYDLSQPSGFAPSQRSASATHAFFVTNWLHDALYDLGFNETARNGQQDNFNRGGLGGDAVNLEVHDFAARNNATFRTRADGEPGRLQLFIFDEPRPSTLTITTTALADGGTFLGAPPAVTRSRSWDVTGPVQTVTDLDGGFGGCDPWINPASYTGGVVILDAPMDGCSIGRRFDAAKDAGVAALILNATGCFSFTEPSLVAVCVEADAGTQLRELAAGGATMSAHLERPAGARERDVALDTTVVAHEYSHFLTGRLIGDSLGLLNSPSRAMGEGWSDFVSLWLSIRDAETGRGGNDLWQGTFAIGGWSVGGPNWDGASRPAHYFGFRRYPYSTDRTKNPLTFKHVGTNVPLPTTAARDFGGGPDNAQVHNAGEVWASMLWDAQVKLLRKPGVTTEAARLAMGRYLLAALKATPMLPTFIEARDALLAVVAAESPTVDFPLFQEAFAQRGLGVLAQSSDRRSITNTPLAEDFTGPGGNYRLVSVALDDTDDDCDSDGQLDSNETGTVTVKLMNVGTRRLSRSTLRLNSSNPSLQVSPSPVMVPATEPFTVATVTVPTSLGVTAGFQSSVVSLVVQDPDISLLQGRFEASATVRLNVDLLPSMKETFENDAPGWTFDGDGNFPWEQLWFVRSLNTVSHVLTGRGMDGSGESTATTPPLAVGAGPFTVTFTQTYLFETSVLFQHFDGGRLEVSTDGVNFSPVPGSALTPAYPITLDATTNNPLAGQQAFGGSQSSVQTVTVDFGTQYANRTVWLRWRIGTDDASGTSGWSIDDVQANGLTTEPFVDAVPHRNRCTNHLPIVSGTTSITVNERTPVTLLPGTLSDRDLDALTVTWSQTSGTSVELLDDTFTSPEVGAAGETLGFRVTVDDGKGGMDTDDMTVTVRNVNRRPEVMAGGSTTVGSGQTATLEATGTDADGDPLTYLWQQQGDATVTLGEATAAQTTFVAPEVKVPELISFRVIALDADTASEPAFIAITITPKPSSCGCTTLEPLLAFGVLLFLRRRRAGASPRKDGQC
ncbi:MAG: M36 family metallopeptidase [Archangium sp.]|nr:M36 family metallopeptidase [Archangium sp.]